MTHLKHRLISRSRSSGWYSLPFLTREMRMFLPKYKNKKSRMCKFQQARHRPGTILSTLMTIAHLFLWKSKQGRYYHFVFCKSEHWPSVFVGEPRFESMYVQLSNVDFSKESEGNVYNPYSQMEEVAAIQKESKEKSKTYSSSLPCKVPSNFPSQVELVNVITQPIKLDHSGLFW